VTSGYIFFEQNVIHHMGLYQGLIMINKCEVEESYIPRYDMFGVQCCLLEGLNTKSVYFFVFPELCVDHMHEFMS